jgi:hypothetical protein
MRMPFIIAIEIIQITYLHSTTLSAATETHGAFLNIFKNTFCFNPLTVKDIAMDMVKL